VTLQCPPGQSTSQAPVHVTSHRAAPSQCTWLASPTEATHLFFTCWHATTLLVPDVTSQSAAFWQDALLSSPPCSLHVGLPFAQNSEHCGVPGAHDCSHDAPAWQ
jgi:hypothetical protein